MLEIENLSFSYGKTPVLQNVDFRADFGDVVAVLGANGAGKSTLFKCASGLLKNFSGNVKINGQDVKKLPAAELAKIRAVLEQETRLAFESSVLDVVLLGRFAFESFSHTKKDGELARYSLELARLGGFENRAYFGLSGGEKRRVMFAKTLCQALGQDGSFKGKTIMLDEPAASLDPLAARQILKAAKLAAADGACVLAILHDPNLAGEYSSKTILLGGGRLFAKGNTSEVLTAENLETAYSCPVKMPTLNGKKYAFFTD